MTQEQKFGLAVVIFSVVWWFVIPMQVRGAREALYPRFVTIWIGMSGFLLILRSWKAAAQGSSSEKLDKRGMIRVFVIAAVFLVYVMSIEYFGFIIPSLAFLIILMFTFGVRDWKLAVGVPLALLAGIYIFVEKILAFPLPRGKFF